MEAMDCIYTRRSVRKFTEEPVSRESLMEVMNAGRWAPSGLNNQPWRFVPITGTEARQRLSGLTKYGRIIIEAPAAIAVFLDREAVYNETKDLQGIGACLQNMLLASHALGLGAVWLGEILNRAEEARQALGISDSMELMAVVALGHPASEKHRSQRKELTELIIAEL